MPEKNETQLEFPCKFPIKIMGRTNEVFEAEITAIIKKHVPNLPKDAIVIRASKEGKYTAITVTFMAESKKQLDDLYTELSSHKLVIMAL